MITCTNKKEQQKQLQNEIILGDIVVLKVDSLQSDSGRQAKHLDELKEQKIIPEEPHTPGTPFFTVEQMPKYPGGDIEMYAFISKNLKLLNIAEVQGLQRRIVVRFVVNKKGDVKDAKNPSRSASRMRFSSTEYC